MKNHIYMFVFITTIAYSMPFAWKDVTEDLPAPFTNIQEDSQVSGVIFAVSNNGKLFRSVNWGKTWLEQTPPTSGQVRLSAQMHASVDCWLIWAEEANERQGTLWRSDDLGANWYPVTSLNVHALHLTASRHVPDLLLMLVEHDDSGQRSLLRSTDGGANWSEVLAQSSGNPIVWHPTTPWKIYIGSLVSNDFGESWSDGSGKVVRGSDRKLPPGLYSAETSGLFVSRDDARSWWPLMEEKLNVFDASYWSDDSFVTGFMDDSEFALFFSDDGGERISPWTNGIPNGLAHVRILSDWLIYGFQNDKVYLYDESPADLDNSLRIDGGDLIVLSIAFGSDAGSPFYNAKADLNNDGRIDGQDLTILSLLWGKNFSYDDTKPPGDFPSE